MGREIIERVEKMETRILNLPEILQQANESFLLKYSIALLFDIELTKERFNSLATNQNVKPFKSKVSEVVKRKIEQEHQIIPQIHKLSSISSQNPQEPKNL